MFKYPFLSIDTNNFALAPRREGAGVYHTTSPNNEGDKQNYRTEGSSISANFFVMPPQGRNLRFRHQASKLVENRGL